MRLAAFVTIAALVVASLVACAKTPTLVDGLWGACGTRVQGSAAQCMQVTVPKDWGNPGNGTLDLVVARLPAKDQASKIGSIIINPGGPGGSGLDFLPYLGILAGDLNQRFDLVSFDPRGVGLSSPIQCFDGADLDATFAGDPDPVDDATFNAEIDLNRKMVAACQQKYGDDLKYFSTVQTAKDMDAIRNAVGDTRMNYLGFSYGTELGAVYAQLFPTTIRTMVLDGAVDLQQTPVESSEGQAAGFEHALDNFSTWCAANTGTCPIAPDGRGAISDALASARANPVTAADGRKVTAGWVFWGVVSSLYSKSAWPDLASAIAGLRDGKADGILKLADSYAERDSSGHYSNLFDANNAINCVDGTYPSLDEIRTLQSQWRDKYPVFGAPLALGLTSCALWPVAGADPVPVGPAVAAPPIIVVGTLGDPATPYENTQALATMLGTGQVITSEGEGHTSYLENQCVTQAVNAYFVDVTLPATDLRCPA